MISSLNYLCSGRQYAQTFCRHQMLCETSWSSPTSKPAELQRCARALKDCGAIPCSFLSVCHGSYIPQGCARTELNPVYIPRFLCTIRLWKHFSLDLWILVLPKQLFTSDKA